MTHKLEKASAETIDKHNFERDSSFISTLDMRASCSEDIRVRVLHVFDFHIVVDRPNMCGIYVG